MKSTSKSTAERIQSWMPTDLADQLRAQALVERRSIAGPVATMTALSIWRGRWPLEKCSTTRNECPGPL